MSRMTIPIGPQHPALKEPLCFMLTLEGEQVVESALRLGYVHRGLERLCQQRNYIQNVHLVERVCGICSHAHTSAFCACIEEMCNLEIPRRAMYIRGIVGELERLHSHLLWLGVAAHEIGRVINPLTATSQVYGGVIMGLGFALSEERVIDAATGLQLTANLEDYRAPVMSDIPDIDVIFVGGVDTEANPVGAKGLGEPPIIPPAAAIANAVADALGVRVTDLPITPARVLAALRVDEEVVE